MKHETKQDSNHESSGKTAMFFREKYANTIWEQIQLNLTLYGNTDPLYGLIYFPNNQLVCIRNSDFKRFYDFGETRSEPSWVIEANKSRLKTAKTGIIRIHEKSVLEPVI